LTNEYVVYKLSENLFTAKIITNLLYFCRIITNSYFVIIDTNYMIQKSILFQNKGGLDSIKNDHTNYMIKKSIHFSK